MTAAELVLLLAEIVFAGLAVTVAGSCAICAWSRFRWRRPRVRRDLVAPESTRGRRPGP